ncbi:hypothetical protein C4556_01960 [Candidatus Parcubacteria bacterium]|nr:MAG: hypothetical protein C4556_01960 [Candidatus Parcubacteria bacterium]
MKKERVVAVSGGFDPLHIGHVRMFKAARKLGDKLVVILNNDNWLKGKKKYAFMPKDDRKPDGDPVPEVAACEELGIKVVYNVGKGGKVQSSSWMVSNAVQVVSRKKTR